MKGIVLSSIAHPHVAPNPYGFLSSVEHKRRISEDCAGFSIGHKNNEHGLKLSSFKKGT